GRSGEGGRLGAEAFRGGERTRAFDVPGLAERAPPPQAGRSRDADPARQLDIGDAAVVLQLLENLSVDGIETGSHGSSGIVPCSRIVSNAGAPCETLLRRAVAAHLPHPRLHNLVAF